VCILLVLITYEITYAVDITLIQSERGAHPGSFSICFGGLQSGRDVKLTSHH